MRTTMTVAIVLTSGVLGLFGARQKETARHKPAKSADLEAFVVHEWGTFTNFSASDGTQLAFRSVLGEELPPFVRHDLSIMLAKGEIVARQRMETPVTYFYTDRSRTVEARVGFPTGRLTEFYPPANGSSPFGDVIGPTGSDSSLTWRLAVHPRSAFDSPPQLPEVETEDRYGFARETDSAVVEVTDNDGQKYCEKFLFYRGAGNFSLPLRLEAFSQRRFRVVNDGPDAIDGLFMVAIGDEGLRFREFPTLGGHAALNMQVPVATTTAEQLGERMTARLVAAGLYQKEARAMVDTWHSSWFREPGTRLFYLVPRKLTDEIIPLSVDPVPDQTVRVLVGRMEILTPEAAARLRNLAKDGGSDPADELSSLGRFARPALDYLAEQASDPAVHDALKRLRSLARR